MAISAIALFCDDVRQELGGQRSLIGLYESGLRGETYPFDIPELFSVTILRFPVSETPNQIAVTIHTPGAEDQTVNVPETTLAELREPDQREEDVMQLRTLELHRRLRHLTVSGPLTISVTVQADEHEFLAGALTLAANEEHAGETKS